MSQKETRTDPYVIAEKYGYIEGDSGMAFIGFAFPQEVTIPPTERFFVGVGLDEVEELVVILQDHINRNRNK
ncbi:MULTISPECIES: hypothetical protein [Serratia]|uniref:hypothetical protein n=1 Tax=Serratia TaxID=613 RepID=UPI00128E9A5D|nr:hypothetical protein [Serratia sp. 506_PEND]